MFESVCCSVTVADITQIKVRQIRRFLARTTAAYFFIQHCADKEVYRKIKPPRVKVKVRVRLRVMMTARPCHVYL